MSLARLDDGVGHRSLVEGVGSVLRDALECRGEILLHQPVAGLIRAAALEEDRCDVRLLGEAPRRRVENIDGAMTASRLMVPYFLRAVSRPSTVPGTPIAR